MSVKLTNEQYRELIEQRDRLHSALTAVMAHDTSYEAYQFAKRVLKEALWKPA